MPHHIQLVPFCIFVAPAPRTSWVCHCRHVSSSWIFIFLLDSSFKDALFKYLIGFKLVVSSCVNLWWCPSLIVHLLYPEQSRSEGHQGANNGRHGQEQDRKLRCYNGAAALCVRLWRGCRSSLLDIPFPLGFELPSALLKEFPRLMSSFQNHAGFPLPGDKAKEGSMPSVVTVLSWMDPGSLPKNCC